ncbi:MAG TPA: DNA topoisomerase 3 [Gallicola sp.]|nr:DNA topoisomerase 3 [Gallicola sp.]
MKLVIAEKPSVAMSIAKVLNVSNRKNGYLEGNGYIVSWCIGHLVGLANADEYEEKYKTWRMEDLPIIPKNWKLTVFKQTSKQFNLIKKLMNDNRVEEVICATDAGREGELIFRLVYEKANCNKPIKRLWISSMEETAIKEGFTNLKSGDEYLSLYKSALSRAKADWIVGINATRLFTTLYKNLLSVGRVQTPTLSMMVDREVNIEQFKSEPFYHLALKLDGFSIESNRFQRKDDVENLLESINEDYVKCIKVERQEQRLKPPLPFDLTTLQREANRYFGYTAKQTLDYLQSLYEKKWITYPRTDSRYITEDMKDTVMEIIKLIGADVDIEKPNIKRICNNNKVTDDHAIIPTLKTKELDLKELPRTEQQLYGLICTKLLTSVLEECIEQKVKVIFEVEGFKFTSSWKETIRIGFRDIENRYLDQFKDHREPEENKKIPQIEEGKLYRIENRSIKEGKTTPPKHFTEDTLLSAMERAGNEELDESLDIEKRGLGTPATRAGIIEKLIAVGYLERKNKKLIATKKAYHLITVVPEELKSPKLTSDWENKLTKIASGEYSEEKFINEIEGSFTIILNKYSI